MNYKCNGCLPPLPPSPPTSILYCDVSTIYIIMLLQFSLYLLVFLLFVKSLYRHMQYKECTTTYILAVAYCTSKTSTLSSVDIVQILPPISPLIIISALVLLYGDLSYKMLLHCM